MGSRPIRRAVLCSVRMLDLRLLPHANVHTSSLHLAFGQSCVKPACGGFELHLLECCAILRTHHTCFPATSANTDLRIFAPLRESPNKAFSSSPTIADSNLDAFLRSRHHPDHPRSTRNTTGSRIFRATQERHRSGGEMYGYHGGLREEVPLLGRYIKCVVLTVTFLRQVLLCRQDEVYIPFSSGHL